jgi:hypothetical protein
MGKNCYYDEKSFLFAAFLGADDGLFPPFIFVITCCVRQEAVIVRELSSPFRSSSAVLREHTWF